MKKVVLGSSMFISGLISSTMLLISDRWDTLLIYFFVLLAITYIGLIIMAKEAFVRKSMKRILQSNYDITGKRKNVE